MDVFGDAWTSLIMGDAVQAVTRLDKFQKSLGVARNTLSDRLNKLVDSGVLVKRLYQDHRETITCSPTWVATSSLFSSRSATWRSLAWRS
jgi:DNA-binding HxlR family transcriptional regulator